jgi:4-hydroxy-tetrahydrodipicolinate reductase
VTLRIAVFGGGRLGREIVALAPDRDATVVVTFGRDVPASPEALRASAPDVAIDVSVAEAVVNHAHLCFDAGVPLVIGVTGWQEHVPVVAAAADAADGAVLIAPNFSIGATLFTAAVADAARKFSRALGFDAAIVETHHAMKKDAPSGTARSLAEAVLVSRGADVPVSSVRVGHVPGVHTLVLDAPFEQITLTHEARDRRVFADGALRAAHWLHGRTGRFTMADIVRDMTGES